MKINLVNITVLAALGLMTSCSTGGLTPTDLTCEWMSDPRVVDVAQPHLAWINEAPKGAKNEIQSAYQILVASSEDLLVEGKADLWDSGKISSDQSTMVAYAGKPLASGADCFWKVRTWNSEDSPSEWSSTGYWGMGLLDSSLWTAQWIGAPWQSEDTYKKVELEKPMATPAGMSQEMFRLMVQNMMDNPGSNPFSAFTGGGAQGGQGQGRRERQQRGQAEADQPQNAGQNPAAAYTSTKKEYITEQTPAPYLRKGFSIDGKIASAKAYVVGLGYYEFYINGQKVGNEVLVPNQTNYSERPIAGQYGPTTKDLFRDYRVLYTAHDITSLLQEGNNVAGAIVGEGFYNAVGQYQIPFGSSRFLCQIEVEMEDGSHKTIVTDDSWKSEKSPILVNGVFEGEVYDANAEIKDWCSPSFDDSAWQNAALRNAPTGKLSAHTSEGDVIYDILKPVSIQKLEDGSYDVDFGVEITGWVRLMNFKAEKGSTVTMTFENDQIINHNRYIADGTLVKEYAPRFTFFTFSKVNVAGLSDLTAANLQAEWVCTNLKQNSEFSSSNTLFENILTIWKRSQLDNTHGGLASDCPQRERSGYTGDGQVSSAMVMDYFDAAAFYKKWVRDMNDCQNVASGHVPNIAPTNNGAGGIAWGAAIDIIPWEYYRHYGDKSMLEQNYFAMKEYIRYMEDLTGPDGIVNPNLDPDFDQNCGLLGSLGDWCSPFGNPERSLVHQFYYWQCADIVAKTAKILGNAEDYKKYSELKDKLYEAFHKKFYKEEGKTYGPKGANVFALEMGVPEDRVEDAVEALRKEIVEDHEGHLMTGIFGTRYLFEVLGKYGLNDIAFEAMNKTDFPSYGEWVAKGATTTWEDWDGHSSRNHPMFGGGLVWLNNTLAGVQIDENEPGYRHIIIKPVPVSADYNVTYSHKTPYGVVSSTVASSGSTFKVTVTVPVGSHATVVLPYSGKSHQVGQGTYTFTDKK